MKKINFILCMVLLGISMNACKKDEGNTYSYEVKMTDAPGPYNAVYIDLEGVEITGENNTNVMLNVHAGIYNLLDLTNGTDVLIASGDLDGNRVSQIRLILGTNNSVVAGGISYPLSTPSADQSGLKIAVNHTLEAGVLYKVLLDFDANQSIVETGTGTYKLKPVIRTIVTTNTGTIKGKITPIGTLAFVNVDSGLSYSTNVSANGDFMLRGISAGTYSVTVTPPLPLIPVTVSNIVVGAGATADVGTIILQ